MGKRWAIAATVTVALLGILTPAEVHAAAPHLIPPGGTFFDDDGNIHEGHIEAIAAAGITRGCGGSRGDLYCPDHPVTRGELAAMLARALRLPPAGHQGFVDIATSRFRSDIDRIAAAGVTRGCNPPANDRYCPDRAVTRGELAVLFTRAFGYEQRARGAFIDDDGSPYEHSIERLAAAGVTRGCNPPANDRFCPELPVRRDELASMLSRALGLDPLVPPPRPVRTLAFTGDTLIHTVVSSRAAANATGSRLGFDFRPMFAPVRGLIEAADLALCHLEVPLSADNAHLSGYPLFSAPYQVADAVAWAGYDGCSAASNHSIDQGSAGAFATMDVVTGAGLGLAGMARSADAGESIEYYDVDGLRVAHISATYWLNGLRLPASMPWLVDLIDEDRILGQAAIARREGAGFVVVSLHCCLEYQSTPTSYQRSLGRRLIASDDIDLVIGHHAHVVQPIEQVGEEYVVYGLGNFLSAQRRGTTDDGVIVFADVTLRGDRWVVKGLRFTPTWVEPGTYRILPAAETLRSGTGSWLAANLEASWRATTATLLRYRPDGVVPTARP